MDSKGKHEKGTLTFRVGLFPMLENVIDPIRGLLDDIKGLYDTVKQPVLAD